MVGFLSARKGDQQELPAQDELPAGAEEQEMEDEQPNVSPEEQAMYDAFVDNGYKLIYSGKSESGKPAVNPAIVESLKGNGNTVDGLATTTFMVVQRLEQSAAGSGSPVSQDVLYHGAVELLEDLAELQEALGIDEAVTEDEMQEALYRGLDMYRMAQQSNPEIKGRAQEDMKLLAEATSGGRLGQLIPGGDNVMAGMNKNAPAQAAEQEAI